MKKTSQTESVAIWHARLSHVDYQMLQKISSKKLVDDMPTSKSIHEDVVYQGCQYEKSQSLPFKTSTNRISTLFELVHMDLMGQIRYQVIMVIVA